MSHSEGQLKPCALSWTSQHNRLVSDNKLKTCLGASAVSLTPMISSSEGCLWHWRSIRRWVKENKSLSSLVCENCWRDREPCPDVRVGLHTLGTLFRFPVQQYLGIVIVHLPFTRITQTAHEVLLVTLQNFSSVVLFFFFFYRSFHHCLPPPSPPLLENLLHFRIGITKIGNVNCLT